MGTQICSMYGQPSPQEAQSARNQRRCGTPLERHGNAFGVGWPRVYGFAGNRGRRRHAGGSASSLRLCAGAGSRSHANKRGTAWLSRDGEASRAVHITPIERRVLLPDLNLRSHSANGLATPLKSDFAVCSKEVFVFLLFAFRFSLCPCPASGT
jgi:hypothetical protein